MVHISYGDSAKSCILEAIELHNLVGSKVIVSRDDFTQGPLTGCGPEDDFSSRISYWSIVDREISFGIDVATFYKESIELFDDLDNTEVLVWQGDSAHDILATAWLMYYLQHRNIEWYIIDLGSISPENENNGLPAVNLAMFSPEQVIGLYKYKQVLPSESIQIYIQLWKSMVAQNGAYRIKKGDELISVSEDYHDAFILGHMSTEMEQASKTIGKIMEGSNHSLSDTTIEWRIRKLIELGLVQYEGDLKLMSEYKVRKFDIS